MAIEFLLLFLCLFVVPSLGQQVLTPDGPVLGIRGTTNNNRTYHSYYSLRYAKPPVGSLRFLAPEPIEPWTEVYNATTENTNICYQLDTDSAEETEDCLFLSVFTPQDPLAPSRNYPLLVYIHGGGFFMGSGHTGGFMEKYFMETEVVLVFINYRLGVFGFLSTGDDVIPGNAGLKDQIMALKWIQRNIAAFGGDPTRVTISGQSAGSASVGYLILSPAASGLFSSAIAQSGSCISPWAYQRNQTEISFKTASFIDPQFETSRDSFALKDVLQKAVAKDIDSAGASYANWASSQPDAYANYQIRQGFYFAPVIEAANDDAFLTELQYESLSEGNINKVPLFIGMTSEEGLMNLDDTLNDILQAYDNNNGYMVPHDIHVENSSDWQEIANLIKQEYSPDDSFSVNKLGAIQFFTEQDVARSIVKHAELQSEYSDVYVYEFSYSGYMGFNTNNKYPGSGNVTHGEELTYLYIGMAPELFPESDQLVHNRLIKLWSNFVTYHNPTPVEEELLQNIIWPKVQPDNFQFVNIGNFGNPNLTIVQGKPKSDRIAFWDSIYEKYGHRPYDTY